MRRLMIFAIGVVGFFSFITVLFYVVSDIKSARPAILHLKPGVIDGGDRDGEVTTTDKYITVRTDQHGREIFTWDQILYISEKDLSSSRRLDRIVDLIDLLSKFGLVATVLFFMVGLYQYGQSQKWEREKFLAAAVKDFDDSKTVRSARQMLDSLALYPKGRKIDFINTGDSTNQKAMVLNNDIYAALTIEEKEICALNDQAMMIRDCFDDFLSSLITFSHYIDQNLITKDALSAHVGYWIELLGPGTHMKSKYVRRIFAYAENYWLLDVETLVLKYHDDYDWRELTEDKDHDGSVEP